MKGRRRLFIAGGLGGKLGARARGHGLFARAGTLVRARTFPRVLPPAIAVPSMPAMTQRHTLKTNHVTAFWVAALDAACGPNGHADAKRYLGVRMATQTTQNG